MEGMCSYKKTAVFWYVVPQSLVDTDVSEVLTDSIIRTLKCWLPSTRPHGALSQKMAIFILVAMKTINLTTMI
jgi:hypothetical protein